MGRLASKAVAITDGRPLPYLNKISTATATTSTPHAHAPTQPNPIQKNPSPIDLVDMSAVLDKPATTAATETDENEAAVAAAAAAAAAPKPQPKQVAISEEDMGIVAYANAAPGFAAVLKQRYSDFVVNEVGGWFGSRLEDCLMLEMVDRWITAWGAQLREPPI